MAHGYLTHPSRFGDFAVVWREGKRGSAVVRILLPGRGLVSRIRDAYPDAAAGRSLAPVALARDIAACLHGKDHTFPLSRVRLDACSAFQRRVLQAEHAIPRGRVSAYGDIAAHLGRPGAARAVGRALATNPFPIVVPCHRAIRGDGGLGGYQGGTRLKRALLEMEGVEISPRGRVLRPRWHYRSRESK
jgi:methylated-DNA-[protein]-cysteine S-methyltransferase